MITKSFKLTNEEANLIEKMASNLGESFSEYMRNSALYRSGVYSALKKPINFLNIFMSMAGIINSKEDRKR